MTTYPSVDTLSDTIMRFVQLILSKKLDKSAVFFNGGKDATLVLFLLLNTYAEYGSSQETTIPIVYINTGDEFDEIVNFIKETAKSSPPWTKFIEIKASTIKEGLFEFSRQYREIEYLICGTRLTDPFSENFSYEQKCSQGWPNLVRLNPILEWTYDEVWSYILKHNVKYCELYDQGYTSIGLISNTLRNPSLWKDGEYLHAHELENPKEERIGRI